MKIVKDLLDSIMGVPLGIGASLSSLAKGAQSASATEAEFEEAKAKLQKLQEELNVQYSAQLDAIQNAQKAGPSIVESIVRGLGTVQVSSSPRFIMTGFSSATSGGGYDYRWEEPTREPRQKKPEPKEELPPPDLSERPISFED